jgi:hypothetical protein
MSFPGVESRRRIVPVSDLPDFGEDGFYIKDDFFSGGLSAGQVGELNWGTLIGGASSWQPGEAGHPGIFRRETTTTSGTLAYLRIQAVGNGPLFAADLFDSVWIFRLNANDGDTAMRVGFGNDSSGNPPASGIYMEKVLADTEWFAVTRTTSVQSRSAALAAVDTGWHRLRIRRVDAGAIGFTLDGGTEVTLTTNIPTVALNPVIQIINGAAANKTLDIDFFSLRITSLNR